MKEPQDKTLHVLSDLVTMRFAIKNTNLYQAWRNKLTVPQQKTVISVPDPKKVVLKKSSKNLFHFQNLLRNDETEELKKGLKLKYFMKLSQQHILVGNQWQLDMLRVGLIDSYVDVNHCWSIVPTQPILSLSVQRKYNLIAMAGPRTFLTLRFSLKEQTKKPWEMLRARLDKPILAVSFIQKLGVFVVMENQLKYYRISWHFQKAYMEDSFTYKYDITRQNFETKQKNKDNKQMIAYFSTMKVYKVPQPAKNTLNIYFSQQNKKLLQQKKFGLWVQSFKVISNYHQIVVGQLVRLYNIQIQILNTFNLFNYNAEICLLQSKSSLIVFKQGYMIDGLNSTTRNDYCFIKYVEHSRTLFYFLEKTIDVYHIEMDQSIKPQKFKLSSQDCFVHNTNTNPNCVHLLALNQSSHVMFFQKPSNNPNDTSLTYTFALTRPIALTDKIQQIYPSQGKLQHIPLQILEERCGIIEKLGLQKSQAYFQLWKRSGKQSVTDYQILICTKDYGMVLGQIENKLRSQSMSVRQIIKILGECISFLHERSKGECQAHTFEELTSCHLLQRKLEMFWWVSGIKKQLQQLQKSQHLQQNGQVDQQIILINIKDFYELKQFSLVDGLVDLLSTLSEKYTAKLWAQVRGIFKYFRLTLQLNYMHLLKSVQSKCKIQHLLNLITKIPQLLPYNVQKGVKSTSNIKQNDNFLFFWQPIQQQQKDTYFFIQEYKTLDNRKVIPEFISSLWFKRNQNTTHACLTQARQKVKPLQSCHSNIFIQFLCQIYSYFPFKRFKLQEGLMLTSFVFQNLSKKEDQSMLFLMPGATQLVRKVQRIYPLYPQHLVGKFELYLLLYKVFHNNDPKLQLFDFLSMAQPELFKMFFEREKVQKGGFIIHKIKPLYQQMLSDKQDQLKLFNSFKSNSVNKGQLLFNQGIADYFASKESSVRDLKCILNKLNNQKNEFHLASVKLYQVLIKAIMLKVRIGGQDDTPIDQILVYIDNIPFPTKNESIMSNLAYIQGINYESQMLRKIKVNMTLDEIINKPQDIIETMVYHQIHRLQVMQIQDYRNLKLYAYKILAQVQCRKSNIYGDQFNQHSLKVFITKIAVNPHIISLCEQLLVDQVLGREFGIDSKFIQEIVEYLYKQRLCQQQEQPHYMHHEEYLKALVKLLDKENSLRKFIQLSINYASLMTFQIVKIQYPLFPTYNYYPAFSDLQVIFDQLSPKQMQKVDLQQLFNTVLSLKQLGDSIINPTQMADWQFQQNYKNKLKYELYQFFIVRCIELNMLNLALQNTTILMNVPTPLPTYNIVYPILILEKIFPEQLPPTQALFNKVISYCFSQPKQLCDILRKLSKQQGHQAFSNNDLDSFLIKQIKKRQNLPIFGKKNTVIASQMLGHDSIKVINRLLEQTFPKIIQRYQLLKKTNYIQIEYRIMLCQPLVLAKWIWCRRKSLNMKTLRLFFSYMAHPIMRTLNGQEVLKQTIQALKVLQYRFTHNTFFSQIVEAFRENRLNPNEQADKIPEVSPQQNLRAKDEVLAVNLIKQSISQLNRKIQKLRSGAIQVDKDVPTIRQIIEKPQLFTDVKLKEEHDFKDEDQVYERQKDQLALSLRSRRPRSRKPSFNPRIQIKNSVGSEQKESYDQMPKQEHKRKRKLSEYNPGLLIAQESPNLSRSSSNRNINQSALIQGLDLMTLAVLEVLQNRQRYLQNNSEIDQQPSYPKLSRYMSPALDKSEQLNNSPIPEDFGENLPSMWLIKVISEQQKRESKQEEEKSFSETQSIQIQYNSQDSRSKSGRDVSAIQPQDRFSPQELASRLLRSKTNQLSLAPLLSISHQPSFKDYLLQLLEALYESDQLFTNKLSLLIIIVTEFSSHFNTQAVKLLNKMAKYKDIKQLPENASIFKLLPPSMLFQAPNIIKNIIPILIKQGQHFKIFQFAKMARECFGKNIAATLVLGFIHKKLNQFSQNLSKNSSNHQDVVITLLQELDDVQLVEKSIFQLRNQKKPHKNRVADILDNILNIYKQRKKKQQQFENI